MVMAEPADIPRIDALAGWPEPEAQTEWYGAAEAEAVLRRGYTSGRMHHAWLITGSKGVGKATLAFRFARFVLANPDPPNMNLSDDLTLAVLADARVSRLIVARAHPDLLVLRRPWDETAKRYRNAVTVDEVRRIQRFFGSTAGENGWRICIVDTADDLNINAANALLKMLEEPPKRGLFLLVANRPGQILPTIRSRCGRLDLKPLPPEHLFAAIKERHSQTDDSELRLAVALAGGSLRRAIQALQSGQGSIYRSFIDLTGDLPALDFTGVHQLADAIAIRGKDIEFENFIQLVGDWLSRRVREHTEPAGNLSPATKAASLASWATVWEKVRESSLQAEILNLDRKQVVLQVFMALARATRT